MVKDNVRSSRSNPIKRVFTMRKNLFHVCTVQGMDERQKCGLLGILGGTLLLLLIIVTAVAASSASWKNHHR
jgi:hypothetical protein